MTPIYEDVLPLELMRKLERNSECGDCGGVLTVAWSPNKNSYMLRCGTDINHNTTKKVDLSAEYAEYASKLGWRNKRLENEIGTKKELALRQYEYLPRLNKEQATEIVKTIWPDAPESERTKAMMVCVQYGLNPLRKHVYLIPFENKKTGKLDFVMVLGINGTRLIAANTIGHYSYQDGTPRVMTDEEQKTVFGAVDTNNLCVITKIKVSNGDVYPGYGKYPKSAVPYGSDKGNSPFNMACFRSERNAFDRACPGQMPEGEVFDEQFLPKVTVEEKVDTLTGEVMVDKKPSGLAASADATVETQPKYPQSTPAPNLTGQVGKQVSYKRDPQTVTNKTILQTACNKDFNGMDLKSIFAELNIKSWDELYPVTFPEAYIKIAGVRK